MFCYCEIPFKGKKSQGKHLSTYAHERDKDAIKICLMSLLLERTVNPKTGSTAVPYWFNDYIKVKLMLQKRKKKQTYQLTSKMMRNPRGSWLLICSGSKFNHDNQVMKGDGIKRRKGGNLSNLLVHIWLVRLPLRVFYTCIFKLGSSIYLTREKLLKCMSSSISGKTLHLYGLSVQGKTLIGSYALHWIYPTAFMSENKLPIHLAVFLAYKNSKPGPGYFAMCDCVCYSGSPEAAQQAHISSPQISMRCLSNETVARHKPVLSWVIHAGLVKSLRRLWDFSFYILSHRRKGLKRCIASCCVCLFIPLMLLSLVFCIEQICTNCTIIIVLEKWKGRHVMHYMHCSEYCQSDNVIKVCKAFTNDLRQ